MCAALALRKWGLWQRCNVWGFSGELPAGAPQAPIVGLLNLFPKSLLKQAPEDGICWSHTTARHEEQTDSADFSHVRWSRNDVRLQTKRSFPKKTLTAHLNSSNFSKVPISTLWGPYSLHQTPQSAISNGQKYEPISVFCTDKAAHPAKDAETSFERRMKLPALKFKWDLNIHPIKKITRTCSNLPNLSVPFTTLCNLLRTDSATSPLSSYSPPWERR